LKPNSLLPAGTTWLLHDGYVRLVTWNDEAECITLGLWGPGDCIISPSDPRLKRVQTIAMSHVALEATMPSDTDILGALQRLWNQCAEIVQISRMRRADDRLLHLLMWMAHHHGRVNSMGHSISLEEMNLTHQVLAETTGLTRVTVTKCLNRFKALGQVIPIGQGDLLIPRSFTSMTAPADHAIREPSRFVPEGRGSRC
jgi:CRP-like cAMP-binding protein